MKLALDCDDVLADYIGTLAEAYNGRFGTAYCTEQFRPDLEALDTILGEEGMRNLFLLFNDEGYVLGLPPVKGAVEGVRELTSVGLDLYVITSRVSTPPEWTQQWLTEQFGPVFSGVFYGGMVNGRISKGELCRQYEIALCVEDHPGNAYGLREQGIRTLLLDYPWNQDVPEGPLIKRVKDWKEIVEECRVFQGNTLVS